jgi:sugar phosphate isomerase/epimerase
MKQNELDLALSLVFVPKLSIPDLKKLGSLGTFKSFALAPSHLSDSIPSLGMLQIKEKVKRFQEFGLKVSSFQGLFYGLEHPSKADIKRRVELLVFASISIGCNFWVVGAPKLRKNELIWGWIVEELCQVEETHNITVSIENICVDFCNSLSTHSWKGYNKFNSFTLDYANAISCKSISWQILASHKQIDHLHLSARDHSVTLELSDSSAISEFWLHSKLLITTIEISESRLVLLLDLAEKMATRFKESLQLIISKQNEVIKEC